MVAPHISDAEILKRLKDGEDSFVERKSLGDWKKDAVKTCVAFANSCPLDGTPGLLCIGVKDDGTIEPEKQNLDTVQKTLERELEDAYPPVPHSTRIVSTSLGRILAVIITASPQGPHFAGPAYVRNGSITIPASVEQFERLIDLRERKVREVLKWKHKVVTMYRLWAVPSNMVGRIAGEANVLITDCDSFVLKLEVTGSNQYISFPLDQVTIAYDSVRRRLAIEVPQN